MKNMEQNYDTEDVPGGVPVKMWTHGVPVEDDAKKQLANAARLPVVFRHIAAMPDVHLGIGATVGSVIPTLKAIIPAAVGVDIGCGMMAAKTTLRAEDLPDNLGPLRSAIERAVPHGRSAKGWTRDEGAWENPPETVDQAWATWLRLEIAPLASAAPLVERLHATCQQIAAAQPECLRGTRLDPAATHARREKLCVRLEKLLGAATEAPRELSLQEMALALRERLATNTIAGDEGGRGQGQDTAREVERISASWMLLGPPLDADARALAERFTRARERARAASK